MSSLAITPLHSRHTADGAKMTPFAGWNMPVRYSGILEEHKHTRTFASIFDVCHMGELLLKGKGATEALSRVVTHNLQTLAPGKCRYGFLLNEQGGVLDDCIAYRLAEEKYMLVVNAARTETDFAWISGRLPAGMSFLNRSAEIAKIDLQGPTAYAVLSKAVPGHWADLKYFGFREIQMDGIPLLISRTGYTGELGYEIYLPWDKALWLWEHFLEMPDVRPAGLGARDTLRLEMGLLLYGQDLDEAHTPVEAGYGGMITSTAPFVGKAGLDRIRERLIGLRIDGRRSARHGDEIYLDGVKVGTVTSGSIAPSLGCCVALAYVRADAADADVFTIKGARAVLEAVRVDLPFYTEGTARKKLDTAGC